MNKGERPGTLRHGSGDKSKPPHVETLAIEALRFFAAHPEEAERFFAWSGLDAGTIRSVASQPGFGFDVLGYFVHDEALLLRFAEHSRLSPADVTAAHNCLLSRERAGDESI